MSALPTRDLTKAHTMLAENFVRRVFAYARRAAGGHAEELGERPLHPSMFSDQELEASASFQRGEVIFTVLVLARRTDA
jgi:hypothetical protein